LGATTYRLMSGFATEMPDDPGLAALTAAPKMVFSSTLKSPLSWPNSELVDGDAVDFVQDIERRAPRPLRTIGSLSLSQSLLKPAWWTASVWSSFPSSPAPPGQALGGRSHLWPRKPVVHDRVRDEERRRPTGLR